LSRRACPALVRKEAQGEMGKGRDGEEEEEEERE